MIRETLATLLYNHGVENRELLDALAWKYAKLMDERDALRAERKALRAERDEWQARAEHGFMLLHKTGAMDE